MDTHAAIATVRFTGKARRGWFRVGCDRLSASGRAARCTAWTRPLLGVVPSLLAMVVFSSSGCGRVEPPASSPSVPVAVTEVPIPESESVEPAMTPTAMNGAQLFRRHCADCHGESGDGNGLAALFLHPKPRNLREGTFRLVTTTNLVPSDDDLMQVLKHGMPGSAMFPFGHLSDDERRELVAHVRHLTRQGIEERLQREAEEFGEEVDPDELAMIQKLRTEPGPRLEIPPDLPTPGEDSLTRGRALYVTHCLSCHGESGKGDGQEDMRDEFGLPVRPRDFTHGIFKGGGTPEQLYARIVLGLPGSPMPASPALPPDEVGDLSHYVLSLSETTRPSEAAYQRTRLVARRISDTFADEIPEAAWEASAPVTLAITPLWWRDDAATEMRVQALHDGQTLALRLSWRDESPEDQAVRTEDFPDMAAVQLFQGTNEPFLGMGSAEDGPVDVWLWNAAAEADRQQFADVDTVYPNMVVDEYPFEESSDGSRPHATERQPREFLTAWAAGNLRSDPSQPLDASNLQAQGFGTLTMRPRTSQAVQAQGHWSEGRWTVTLRRPLQVPPDAGLPLSRGQSYSIAFALWDGAAGDRNGQKLVSIWHDLELE